MLKGLKFTILFILVSVCVVECLPRDLYEGSKCTNDDSTAGICTIVNDCPPAVKQIKRNGHHNFKRCGFRRADEIACCPKADTKTNKPPPDTRLNERKCTQVCQEYAKRSQISLNYQILNGEDAAPGEFPHMVALAFYIADDRNYQFNCGGTLISDKHVLTAAHCIININAAPLKFIRAGTINVPKNTLEMDPTMDFAVDNVTVHPKYMPRTKVNDIALVRLNRSVEFNADVSPACLYTEESEPETMFITGWGLNETTGYTSPILQKARIGSVPNDQCNTTFYKRTKLPVTEKQLCAYDNKTDACQGDSGGPIQIQMAGISICTVVGITSYGVSCGSKYPGVYTRVYSYLDWIESIVWP